MTQNLLSFVSSKSLKNEPEVETFAVPLLESGGYVVSLRSCKSALLNKHWPSKTVKSTGLGYPDILLYIGESERPICVWENKSPKEPAEIALAEAKFYIEGLRKKLPHEPSLPFIAAGFNGKNLLVAMYTNEDVWVSIKSKGVDIIDAFPTALFLASGISSKGVFTAKSGSASASDLRMALPKLKTVYRTVPVLSSGKAPVDFTVALLTLKLIVEQNTDWGSWSELPRLSPGSNSIDQSIGERFETMTRRVLESDALNEKYGAIFKFHEQSDAGESTFAFSDVVSSIKKGSGHFERIYSILDSLPPLRGADFDIFGEVYQSIGDEATKKALGEFFTGRHIISGILPLLASRSGLDKSYEAVHGKRIGDIACGTGGFLTEMLRYIRRTYDLDEESIRDFSKQAFFGYDLSHANASRARVNMYFAGDGFSDIRGGFDSLRDGVNKIFPSKGFDIVATNPPYGKSVYGRAEEAFLLQTVNVLKAGVGHACIVLPTGVLENPRSAASRFALLNAAIVTDVISLPKHAFAPYTQQRTGIIIFQKRAKKVVSDNASWNELLYICGDEKVKMFIVDNDGFANSDKRYETSRIDVEGRWLHNDLASWTNASGKSQPSKLLSAMVKDKLVQDSVDEKGNKLADKFGVFTLSELCSEDRGVALMPDIPLRMAVR